MSLELPALFKYIVENNQPMSDLINGQYRIANRLTEWIWHYRVIEPQTIKSAVESISLPVVWKGDGNWYVKGQFQRSPFLTAVASMPEIQDDNWMQVNVDTTGYKNIHLPTDFNRSFARTNLINGFPVSGALSTHTFLNSYPVNRTRVVKSWKFFTCKNVVDPPRNVIMEDASEGGLPPRLKRLSGCAGCHAILDPLASFFMGIPATDNPNFTTSVAAKAATLGQMHIFPDLFISGITSPNTYYGQNPFTGETDTYATVSATTEMAGYSQLIMANDKHKSCAVERFSEILYGRNHTSERDSEIQSLSLSLSGNNWTVRDVIRAIATSPNFGRSHE